MSLLEVENLSVGFRNGKKPVRVVDDLSFNVEKGEILAIVGESGCGKSASCLALTGLLGSGSQISAGAIRFAGEDIFRCSPRQLRKIRGGRIAYIFQEPLSSLNPVFRIGDQIDEVLFLHRPEVTDRRQEIISLLAAVGIPAPESRINSFPHELSGGMQQRVMIAMALAGQPELLIADEPTTALDVTVQAQIISLLDSVRRDYGTAVILITHNLGVVAQLADRVAVMYAGKIVESAGVRELISRPAHPYTRALLSAVPVLGGKKEQLTTIPGQVPPPDKFPAGCRFCPRCSCAAASGERCMNDPPPFVEITPGHQVRCWEFEGHHE